MVVIIVTLLLHLHPTALARWVLGQRLGQVGGILVGFRRRVIPVFILSFASTGFLARNSQILDLDQLGVGSVFGNEALVGALLDDTALGHDDNVVGFTNGSELVGDNNGGSALGGTVESFLDDAFGVRIQRAGSLVEEEDLGLGDDGSGNGHTLLLPTGQEASTLANIRVVPVGQLGDKVVCES